MSGRGLAYWSDGRSSRIIYVTPGYQMIALDAQTGQRITSFGKGGIVDLKLEDDQEMDPITGDIGLHAAPIIAKDVVIIGAAHTEGSRPVSKRNDKGYVRGFDVKTGKRLWIFHTIPRPGEMGYDTWEQGSEEYTGNNGVWGQMSADEELGLVFLPTEMPTGDYYGGHRPGKNLFSDSLVALDLKTGKRKWHYQFIEHDIWDWDLPCAPIIADVTIDGRLRKIIAQPTKQGWLYVFDRVTGEPIWPFDERKVEASDVPDGEGEPDAEVRREATGVRPPGRGDRRSDRLHAGTACRSGEARIAIQDRSDLHAAGGEQVRWSAGNADAARSDGRG